MVLKKNLPFLVVMGGLAVALIVVFVLFQGQMSAVNKLKSDKEDYETKLLDLQRKTPTQEHLDAVKAQKTDAEKAFTELKQTLLTWWDSTVYDESVWPRQPLLFLGRLETLRDRIVAFAGTKNVELRSGVENMSFAELAQGAAVPREVTLEMLKQQSVMADVRLLLINNRVVSIDSIVWLGSQSGGSLYNKYTVQVTFTCKYPALAKFQAQLVEKSKSLVGTYGEFPRNYLVIEKLAYAAEDRKVAALEASSNKPTGGSSHYPNTGGGYYPGHTPNTNSPYGTPRNDTSKPMEGREPNYNILTVSMTISMVDFKEAITGKILNPDEKEKAAGRSKTASSE